VGKQFEVCIDASTLINFSDAIAYFSKWIWVTFNAFTPRKFGEDLQQIFALLEQISA